MPRMMAAAVLVFVFSSSAVADIYTWTDANGVVHFTDAPPPDQNHQAIEVASPVIVPMTDNLQQQRRASKSYRQMQSVRSPDHGNGSTEARLDEQTKQKQICADYRRKLAQVQSQLRSGYSNNQGNNLRRKRRNLSQSLSRECILR